VNHGIKHISIPKPCTQNWTDMGIIAQGRFCQSCQKTVIDFTQLSDKEILERLSSASNTCGNFDDQQLNFLNATLATPPPDKSRFSWKKLSVAAAAFIGFLSFIKVDAKAKPPVEHRPMTFKKLAAEVADTSKQYKVITGCVTDVNDKLPLPGVSVMVKGTHNGAATDEGGFFKLNVPVSTNTKCIVAFIGYENQEFQTDLNKTAYAIALKVSSRIMGEVVITGPDDKRVSKKTDKPVKNN
jgi:hypothetical protein